MRRGGYIIHTLDGDRPMEFNCVAGSPNEAERIFRRVHPRWRRPIRIEEPKAPQKKATDEKRPVRKTRRKKGA